MIPSVRMTWKPCSCYCWLLIHSLKPRENTAWSLLSDVYCTSGGQYMAGCQHINVVWCYRDMMLLYEMEMWLYKWTMDQWARVQQMKHSQNVQTRISFVTLTTVQVVGLDDPLGVLWYTGTFNLKEQRKVIVHSVSAVLEITCNADLQYFKRCIHDDGLSGFIHQTKSVFVQYFVLAYTHFANELTSTLLVSRLLRKPV